MNKVTSTVLSQSYLPKRILSEIKWNSWNEEHREHSQLMVAAEAKSPWCSYGDGGYVEPHTYE